MKIILFGSTGMLGTYVYKVLSEHYDIQCITRSDFDIEHDSWNKLSDILNMFGKNNVIVNCSGIIPQKVSNNSLKKYIRINTLFPHKLHEVVSTNNCKLIHITTDCVFNGISGNYSEKDTHNETSIYGTSKSLGEPKKATIIRTSIIGEELFDKKSLLEWVKSNKNGRINGYINHYWNGVTCLTLANIIKNIIQKNMYWNGVKHIYSPDIVSKYELCQLINDIYDLNINIIKCNHHISKNRTLTSNYNIFEINTLKQQLHELKNYHLMPIGDYNILNKCRICDNNNNNIYDIIHFITPLAGGFIKNKYSALFEKIYPLTLKFCPNCNTGQINEIITPNKLFTNINNCNYFYYSSTIPYLVKHFGLLAQKIATLNDNYTNILEIGCNDGVLLNQLFKINPNFKCIGIDPSATIKRITNPNIITYNDFFNEDTSHQIYNKNGYMDVIVACNCLAHMNNITEIYNSVKNILHSQGTFILEVHYFKNIIDNLNFDFIYHEHMTYYTVSSFIPICKKYDFFIQNVEFISTHGGSIRLFIKHKNNNNLYYSTHINSILKKEQNIQQDLKQLYNNVEIWKTQILDILNNYKNNNYVISGYGASGRTNTILSYIDFNFDYIFDDSKYKINTYTPYYHNLILSSSKIYELDIKVIFILAWPYTKDIITKHLDFLKKGGKFIKILPTIETVTIDNYINFI
jgi:dTDP-4-dehydrorhamnose reductase